MSSRCPRAPPISPFISCIPPSCYAITLEQEVPVMLTARRAIGCHEVKTTLCGPSINHPGVYVRSRCLWSRTGPNRWSASFRVFGWTTYARRNFTRSISITIGRAVLLLLLSTCPPMCLLAIFLFRAFFRNVFTYEMLVETAKTNLKKGI